MAPAGGAPVSALPHRATLADGFAGSVADAVVVLVAESERRRLALGPCRPALSDGLARHIADAVTVFVSESARLGLRLLSRKRQRAGRQ